MSSLSSKGAHFVTISLSRSGDRNHEDEISLLVRCRMPCGGGFGVLLRTDTGGHSPPSEARFGYAVDCGRQAVSRGDGRAGKQLRFEPGKHAAGMGQAADRKSEEHTSE